MNALVREKMRQVRAKAQAMSASDRTAQDIDEDLDRMAQACSDAQGHWKGGDADEAIAALDDVAAWAKSVKQDITQFKTNSPDVDTADVDPDNSASAKPRGKRLAAKSGGDMTKEEVDAECETAIEALDEASNLIQEADDKIGEALDACENAAGGGTITRMRNAQNKVNACIEVVDGLSEEVQAIADDYEGPDEEDAPSADA